MRRILLIVLVSVAGHASADPFRAAVAANFRDAFESLARAYRDRTGTVVEASYAATGMLYTQIVNGAPFAVFFAADSTAPASLERAGRTVPESRFVYAVGRLALWTPGVDSPGADWLADPRHRLAIADPALAPYGRATMEVLSALGLADAVETRLVKGTSIAQAAHFAATRAVPGAFVARSQLRALDAQPAHVWVVPDSLHAPIEQEAVALRGRAEADALGFLDFVRSDSARAVIESYGYSTVRP